MAREANEGQNLGRSICVRALDLARATRSLSLTRCLCVLIIIKSIVGILAIILIKSIGRVIIQKQLEGEQE